ncbi:MAG: multidrug effflux MFS transporter [Candidatus Paracaedibacteraceae bacterium]|nr:multidrug effflux MFS transporter [Candidatus Paracaedibacteraceae bacterium]
MQKLLFPILILSLVVCCIETDMSAPSFPDMSRFFNVSEGMIQYTIAVNFLGFCLASLFHGALSDSYGRRPVMIFGNALMMIGALGCVWSPSIETLLLARFIQGIGASTSAVIVFAMIADTCQGKEALKRIGILNSVLTIFMSVAPIAGSFINQAIGWRGNYAVVAVLSLLSWLSLAFFLPETRQERSSFSIKKLSKDYKKVFCDTTFIYASSVPSLLCAAYMAFIACAAFLYTKTYGLTLNGYALHQGAIVASFSVMSIFSGSFIERFGRKKSVTIGMILFSIGTLAIVIIGLVGAHLELLVTINMMLIAMGDAIVYAIIFTLSLEIFPDMKGIASSAIMSARAFLVFAFVGLMGNIYNDELISYAWVCLLIFIPTFFCVFKLFKNGFLNETNDTTMILKEITVS